MYVIFDTHLYGYESRKHTIFFVKKPSFFCILLQFNTLETTPVVSEIRASVKAS